MWFRSRQSKCEPAYPPTLNTALKYVSLHTDYYIFFFFTHEHLVPFCLIKQYMSITLVELGLI